MANANSSFGSLATTTLQKYLPKMEETVYTSRPLFFWLNDKQRMDTRGGRTIVQPLVTEFNSTVSSYDGYDAIDTTPQDEFSAAEYQWKQVAASVAASGREIRINQGSEAVQRLVKQKIMSAENTLKEWMDYMFFGDGTGNNSKDFLGLAAIVDDSADLAGIDKDHGILGPDGVEINPWQSTCTTSATNLTLALARTLYNTISVGNDHPDFIISDQDEFEAYEALLQPSVRYKDVKTANAGFENLTFKGSVWTYDDYATAGYVYMLNSKYLELVRHSDAWFSQTPFKEPENQDAQYAQILLMGELTTNNRSRHGRLDGLTD